MQSVQVIVAVRRIGKGGGVLRFDFRVSSWFRSAHGKKRAKKVMVFQAPAGT